MRPRIYLPKLKRKKRKRWNEWRKDFKRLNTEFRSGICSAQRYRPKKRREGPANGSELIGAIIQARVSNPGGWEVQPLPLTAGPTLSCSFQSSLTKLRRLTPSGRWPEVMGGANTIAEFPFVRTASRWSIYARDMKTWIRTLYTMFKIALFIASQK